MPGETLEWDLQQETIRLWNNPLFANQHNKWKIQINVECRQGS